MDTDIRKPDTGAAHFERPSNPASTIGSNSPHGRTPDPYYTEPLSEGEEDEQVDIDIAKNEDYITGLDPKAATEAISYRENFLQKKAHEEEEQRRKQKKEQKRRSRDQEHTSEEDERTPFLRRRKGSALSSGQTPSLAIYPLAPSSKFDQNFKSKLFKGRGETEDESGLDSEVLGGDSGAEPGGNGAIEYVREWRAQKGKKIAVPVRIEPKVYFAAERTFLVRTLDSFRCSLFTFNHTALATVQRGYWINSYRFAELHQAG